MSYNKISLEAPWQLLEGVTIRQAIGWCKRIKIGILVWLTNQKLPFYMGFKEFEQFFQNFKLLKIVFHENGLFSSYIFL